MVPLVGGEVREFAGDDEMTRFVMALAGGR